MMKKILYITLSLVIFASVLITVFKLTQCEERLVKLSQYIRNEHPDLMHENIGNDYPIVSYLKDTVIAVETTKNILQISLVLLVITFLFTLFLLFRHSKDNLKVP